MNPAEPHHRDQGDPPWDAERLLDEVMRDRVDGRSTSALVRELLDRIAPPCLDVRGIEGDRGETGESDAAAALDARPLQRLPAPSEDANAGSDRRSAAPVEIPNHRLLRRIGEGGFGQVWIAHNPHTDHHRACKLVPRDRMLELDGLRRLKQRVPAHPNLMPIEEVGVVDGWLYCLMPLAENAHSAGSRLDVGGYEATTLRLALERRGTFPPAECAAVGVELASALAHLHAHGVTHGDVKPTNVLRLDGRWTLADYGLLRDLSRPTGSGETREFTPPEGPGSPKADQFALGVVLFELSTGLRRNALDASRSGLKEASGRGAEERRLDSVIRRATAAAPEDRFASMREFHAALEHVARGRPRRLWITTAAPFLIAAVLLLALGGPALARWMRDRDGSAVQDPASRGRELADQSHPPGDVAPVLIQRFEIRQSRFDGTNDRLLGVLGRDDAAARVDDDLAVSAVCSSPVFGYLLSLDTTGHAALRVPDSDALAPSRMGELHFPPTPELAFRLTSTAGAQGFLLLVSREPLPTWREFVARHGTPPWEQITLEDDGVWIYDGHSLSVEGATRGDVLPRRGGPLPIGAVVEWIDSLPGIDAVRLVVFPVRE